MNTLTTLYVVQKRTFVDRTHHAMMRLSKNLSNTKDISKSLTFLCTSIKNVF